MSATLTEQITVDADWLAWRYREAGVGDAHIAALIAHWRMIGFARPAERPEGRSEARRTTREPLPRAA